MTERLDALTVRSLLSYEAATGIFRWRAGTRGRRAGGQAGGLNSQGYVHIRVAGRLHKAHRLAWLYHHGHWPSEDIDHVNRIKDDNRISNLRDVSRSLNNRNRPTQANSESGYTGVSIDRRSGKWCVTLRLGTFSNPEEASAAYTKALKTLGLDIEND